MIPSHIQSIPCQIQVERLLIVPPWNGPAHTCPSSDDYYGYTDVEFTVYDRKGYRAKWLEAKLTAEDIGRIEREIIENGDK